MMISYFPKQCAQNSGPVMTAILDSLHHAGHTCVENSLDADAVIIWSVLWAGRMVSNQKVWTHYQQSNRPTIVIDAGALRRGETWKIALNTITADGYYGHTENLDWDRPRKLGITLSQNTSRNSKIVIAAQHARSLQVQHLTSIEDWILQQIHMLKQFTERPIVVRPHPRNRLHLPKEILIETPQRLYNTYDNYNLTFDCHALVNYNSGPGIQAALTGTRPLVDHTSLAYPVSISLSDIEKPYLVDRDQWLVEICHTEYTINEIAKGLWLQRLENKFE